jgi:teichuronic acid biosynthesis glycosyltransferase TuaG
MNYYSTQPPLVSIVTPLFNGQDFIEEAIGSVQEQIFKDWEMIVVDDASTDQSVSIVKSLMSSDPRIRVLLLKENKGAASARNLAISVAKGRYIAFLDCDDKWLPGKLSTQLEYLTRTESAFCFTAYERVDEAGVLLGVVGVPHRLTYKELLKTNYIGCLTAIYDTKVFGKVFMSDSMPCHEDYPVWLKLLREAGPAVGVKTIQAQYRVRTNSLSSNKIRTSRQVWHIYRDVEKLSLQYSLFCFLNQCMRAVIRTYFSQLAIRLGWMHRVEKSSCDKPLLESPINNVG